MSEMNEYLNELSASARQVMDGEGTAAPEQTLWPLTVELGWLLTAVPEALDGLGLGVQGACALQTELGRGLGQAPFLAASLAVDALVHSDLNADTKAEMLGRFTTGELATAPLADVSDLAISEDQSTLGGTLSAVPSVDNATELLLWVADRVLLISLDQPGVAWRARTTWDTTRRLFDVTLHDLPMAQQTLLAQGESARALIARLEVQRDLGLAADAIGAAGGLLDLTIEHLQTREQFGRPLALFQALKHRCADIKTLLAAAEALLADSLTLIGDDLSTPQAQLQAKKTKLIACDHFATLAEEALQLHGGIGMASEHNCHLFLKRAMLNEHLGSGDGDYRLDIAERFLAG